MSIVLLLGTEDNVNTMESSRLRREQFSSQHLCLCSDQSSGTCCQNSWQPNLSLLDQKVSMQSTRESGLDPAGHTGYIPGVYLPMPYAIVIRQMLP